MMIGKAFKAIHQTLVQATLPHLPQIAADKTEIPCHNAA